jgi:hypothetical protein
MDAKVAEMAFKLLSDRYPNSDLSLEVTRVPFKRKKKD